MRFILGTIVLLAITTATWFIPLCFCRMNRKAGKCKIDSVFFSQVRRHWEYGSNVVDSVENVKAWSTVDSSKLAAGNNYRHFSSSIHLKS